MRFQWVRYGSVRCEAILGEIIVETAMMIYRPALNGPGRVSEARMLRYASVQKEANSSNFSDIPYGSSYLNSGLLTIYYVPQ